MDPKGAEGGRKSKKASISKASSSEGESSKSSKEHTLPLRTKILFLVSLLAVTLTVCYAALHWPVDKKLTDQLTTTENILLQAGQWYEQEIVGDHHDDHEDEKKEADHHHDHHQDHHSADDEHGLEGEKMYWEEEWPEEKGSAEAEDHLEPLTTASASPGGEEPREKEKEDIIVIDEEKSGDAKPTMEITLPTKELPDLPPSPDDEERESEETADRP